MKFVVNEHQKNILMMAAVVLISALIFSVFISGPKHAQIDRLRQELNAVKDSLNNIKKIVGDDKDLGRGILKLRAESIALAAKFIKPENVGDLLGVLSEDARESEVEVVSMEPSEFRVCYGSRGEFLGLENLECNKIGIDMTIVGTYKALTDYIQNLENKDAPLMMVRSFDIEKYQTPPALRTHIVVDSFALLAKRLGRE